MEWLKSRLRGTWVQRAVHYYSANSVYDRQTAAVMRRVLKRGSSCVDVGAHQGDILRQMMRLAPEGRHFAFEPLPHMARTLREKFPRAEIHEVALGDRAGVSEFLFVENGPGFSGLKQRIYHNLDPVITKLLVSVKTLDEVIPKDQEIAFIKIDVEGAEYHVLKGGLETIRRCRPVIVLEAGADSTGQYGVTAEDLFSLATETLGYELSTMRRWLKGKEPYTREEFLRNWGSGGCEYYFIATPAKLTRS